ncbi:MAG: ankyrin repeat domain-containing protein [Comamonadaceae bacterium]|nr:ankyrin repeat domain-containing protein [Comamonadaceae bacterium]
MIAALTGRADWTERLLDRGAQLNRPGWTPLHYAASGPEPDVVRRLVERGAHLEARSANGTTPLMMAAAYGDQRSAHYLIWHGADVLARNQRGLTAADFARQAGRDALADDIERAARRRGTKR